MLIILIALSLSMDAFSLALVYGMSNFEPNDKLLISFIVGIFHFIMPFIGYNFGNFIFNFINIKTNILVAIIFIYISIEMFIDLCKPKVKNKISSFLEMMTFGLAVSIDSFSTGLGIKYITNNLFVSFLIFFLFSSLFTYIGFTLGKKINNKLGNIASILGAIILLIIGFSYFFK